MDTLTLDAPQHDPPAASPKRRQVIEAAYQLFLAQGYGAVSMDAVARTACVSKATLYAHFKSKDELFASIVHELRMQKDLANLMLPERTSDLRATLEAVGQRVLRFMLREETLAIYRIATAESARFPELGRAFYANGPQQSYDCVSAWVAVQQAAGLVRPADPLVASQQLMALLRSGVFLRATLGLPPAPSETEINETVAAAVETWLRAFAAG